MATATATATGMATDMATDTGTDVPVTPQHDRPVCAISALHHRAAQKGVRDLVKAPTAARKRPFVPPKIVRYGALEQITLSSPIGYGSRQFEGYGNNSTNQLGFDDD